MNSNPSKTAAPMPLMSGEARNIDQAREQVAAQYGGIAGQSSDGRFTVMKLSGYVRIIWVDDWKEGEAKCDGLPTISLPKKFTAQLEFV